MIETVLYFEDEDGVGRVAREKKSRYDRDEREVVVLEDRLLIERYNGHRWVETESLGDRVAPDDLDVPKP